MAIAGKTLGIKINGQFVPCETSCSIDIEVDMQQATSRLPGAWKEYIPGLKGWSMSVNGNLIVSALGSSFNSLLGVIKSGDTVDIAIASRDITGSVFIIAGTAIPKTMNMIAPSTGVATWVVNFQGTGPITDDIELFGIIIDAMPATADKPNIVDTTNW